MCAMCEGQTAEDFVADVVADIDRAGWAVVAVEDERGDHVYTYTVGLTRCHGHPELLAGGRDFDVAHHVLDDLAALVVDGRRLEPGELLDRGELGRACLMVRVTSPSRLPIAQAVYGAEGMGPVPALQVVWEDADGRWPWEPGPLSEQQVYGKPSPNR